MDTAITGVIARQVWDSRGRPTIEVEVTLASGFSGRAIAPSGASTGRHEALDRRDGGRRLGGFGVAGAIAAVNGEIAAALIGMEAGDQGEIDARLIALDGTPQKARLGGNALVATSMAVAWAAAAAGGVPLWQHLRGLAALAQVPVEIPAPMIQIFGGGKHAGGRIDVQDFLVLCPGASSFAEALEWTAEVYLAAAAAMVANGRLNGVADEGGVWPDFARNEDGLEHLVRAIEAAGFRPGKDVAIALDIAASTFWRDGGYQLALEGRQLGSGELIELLAGWVAAFPIVSIEDPLHQDDEEGFVEITRRLGRHCQIVGDDFLVSSEARIARAAAAGACNTALLKVNQCGTISELIAAAAKVRELGWNAVQSGRSGESEDVTLSHLAVGLGSQQIKVGSMARSERAAKWNEVLRITEKYVQNSYWRFRIPEC